MTRAVRLGHFFKNDYHDDKRRDAMVERSIIALRRYGNTINEVLDGGDRSAIAAIAQ